MCIIINLHLIDWLSEWLIDWLIDCLIDWWIDWLMDRSTIDRWSVGRSVVRSFGRSIILRACYLEAMDDTPTICQNYTRTEDEGILSNVVFHCLFTPSVSKHQHTVVQLVGPVCFRQACVLNLSVTNIGSCFHYESHYSFPFFQHHQHPQRRHNY